MQTPLLSSLLGFLTTQSPQPHPLVHHVTPASFISNFSEVHCCCSTLFALVSWWGLEITHTKQESTWNHRHARACRGLHGCPCGGYTTSSLQQQHRELHPYLIASTVATSAWSPWPCLTTSPQPPPSSPPPKPGRGGGVLQLIEREEWRGGGGGFIF